MCVGSRVTIKLWSGVTVNDSDFEALEKLSDVEYRIFLSDIMMAMASQKVGHNAQFTNQGTASRFMLENYVPATSSLSGFQFMLNLLDRESAERVLEELIHKRAMLATQPPR